MSPLHFFHAFLRQRRGRLPGLGRAEWPSGAPIQPGIRRGNDGQRSTGPAGQHPQRYVRKGRENGLAEGDLVAGVRQ